VTLRDAHARDHIVSKGKGEDGRDMGFGLVISVLIKLV